MVINIENNTYKAALYLRLSREDGDKTESDSIQNQRELLKQFVDKHPEISIASEFVDDGYSGTTFDRPGFAQMMEEVERGNINCILVKDLSRFGRNYIETGKYLERIFMILRIRFIAVNDLYDNSKMNNDVDDILVPFKNILNDSYCRDISIKVRSQLDVKKRKGKFIGSFAPYGYAKDPKDRNHLVIDQYAAETVKRIFEMKINGYNEACIAKQLNKDFILTPLMYKRSMGFRFTSGLHVTANPKWTSQQVSRILCNEVYIGNLVQGKRRRTNYKVKACCDVKPEDWIRVENTHEPIISKDIFDVVQKLLSQDTRTSPNQSTVAIFSGITKCGNCGRSMTLKYIAKDKKQKVYHYYHCLEASTHGKCDSSRLINAEKLYRTVLNSVQSKLLRYVEACDLLRNTNVQLNATVVMNKLDKQIETAKAEIERYSQMSIHLQQDKDNNMISEHEYWLLSQKLEEKTSNAKRFILQLRAKKEEMKLDIIQKQPWIEAFKKYAKNNDLNRKEALILIDKIIVFSKNHVEIQLNHNDEIQAIISTAECIKSRNNSVIGAYEKQ